MNILLFAKADEVPERRIAEFLETPRQHVYVAQLLGVEHEPVSRFFDVLKLNISQLAAAGVKEIRLEFEQKL